MQHFSDSVRALPPWLIIAITVFIALALLSALPLAGYLIERRRRRENFALAMAGGDSFFAGQPDISRYERRAARPAPVNIDRAWETDTTWAGQTAPVEKPADRTQLILGLDAAHPTQVLVLGVFADSALSPVPSPIEPVAPEGEPLTEDPDPVTDDETGPLPEPAKSNWDWTTPHTAAYDVVTEVFEAEVVEAEDDARQLFEADPLGSWVLPPETDRYAYLPEADKVFHDLVARNWLTGEGADVSTEWSPWYADSQLEGASR